MPRITDLVSYLESFVPTLLAATWDNVGLLLGDRETPVERIMTCLTVTPDVVSEAVSRRVDLIVSHHPILFRGAKSLTAHTGDGQIVWPLARAGIAVYSPHTAFDNCTGGINDLLCQWLGIENATPLRPREGTREFKLAVYVPDSDLAKVSDALFNAGAGRIGKYEQCSFRVPGKGTFFASNDTNPAVGEKERREEVEEWRLEVVLPEQRVAGAVQAMREAHSYEEPAFDIYPMKARIEGGEGRIGELRDATTLSELIKRMKEKLRATSVQLVGDSSRVVRRVAVACGAAGEFLPDAIRGKADVFLTGEARFHDAITARTAGIALLVAGHYPTERPAVEELARQLAFDWAELEVWASESESDPLARA